MEEYLRIISFEKEYEKAECLSIHEQMEEFMFLGLRKTKGVSLRDFFDCFSCSMTSVYEKPIKEAMKQGFLKEDGDRIYLTPDGMLVSNQVLCEFLFDDET